MADYYQGCRPTCVCQALQEAVLLCEDVGGDLFAAQPGRQRGVAEGDARRQGVGGSSCSFALLRRHNRCSNHSRHARAAQKPQPTNKSTLMMTRLKILAAVVDNTFAAAIPGYTGKQAQSSLTE